MNKDGGIPRRNRHFCYSMFKQYRQYLIKDGKRRCYVCKHIFELSNDNFSRDRSKKHGFTYKCKSCSNKTNNGKYSKRRLRLRFLIFERDNFTCQYCGRKAPEVILQIDHIFPKSKGGESLSENYKTACKDCNVGKGDYILK